MHKYLESKTTRIMMATVRHVTAWAGRTKYQADGFLLDGVYHRPLMYLKDRSNLRTNLIYFRNLFSKTELTSQHLHGRDCFLINWKSQYTSR